MIFDKEFKEKNAEGNHYIMSKSTATENRASQSQAPITATKQHKPKILKAR